MFNFVFAILVAFEPYPLFAFISDHDSLENCQKAIADFKGDKEVQSRTGCIVMVKPESFEKMRGV